MGDLIDKNLKKKKKNKAQCSSLIHCSNTNKTFVSNNVDKTVITLECSNPECKWAMLHYINLAVYFITSHHMEWNILKFTQIKNKLIIQCNLNVIQVNYGVGTKDSMCFQIESIMFGWINN